MACLIHICKYENPVFANPIQSMASSTLKAKSSKMKPFKESIDKL